MSPSELETLVKNFEMLCSKGWRVHKGKWFHSSIPEVPHSLTFALTHQNIVDNLEKSRYTGGDTETKDEVYTGGTKNAPVLHPLIGDLQGRTIRITRSAEPSYDIQLAGAYVDSHGRLVLVGTCENELKAAILYLDCRYEVLPQP